MHSDHKPKTGLFCSSLLGL